MKFHSKYNIRKNRKYSLPLIGTNTFSNSFIMSNATDTFYIIVNVTKFCKSCAISVKLQCDLFLIKSMYLNISILNSYNRRKRKILSPSFRSRWAWQLNGPNGTDSQVRISTNTKYVAVPITQRLP